MNSSDNISLPVENTAGEASDTAPPFVRLVGWMTLTEKALAACCLFVIVAVMGAHVFARYLFGAPFSWSEEFVRLTLIWMTFLSAAFVMAEGRHITVDVLSPRLSVRGRLWLEYLSHSIVAGACLMLLFGGSHFVWYMRKVGSPSLEIPKSYWYSAVSAGLLLMAIHSILNLLQVVATGKPLERTASAEEEAFHLDMEPGE